MASQIKTTAVWASNPRGYELGPKEKIQIQGLTNIYTIYKKRTSEGYEYVYCTCPAWLYNKNPDIAKTCKHCKAVCGVIKEKRRCATAKIYIEKKHR